MECKLTNPREKWFFLIVLPLAIAIEWAFAATLDWSAYPSSEWIAKLMIVEAKFWKAVWSLVRRK